MTIKPLITDENWHGYAGASFGVPAAVGYLYATAHYVDNLKELLATDLSLLELKAVLQDFITERDSFIQNGERYMDEGGYKTHPEYIAELKHVPNR